MRDRFMIFGLGYTGRALARALVTRGWRVAATTRSGQGAPLPGVDIFRCDRDHPLPPSALAGVRAVLSTVPPDGRGDPVIGPNRAGLLAARPDWTGYLSTTGMYGDHGGGWVDEDTPPDPGQDRARRRLETEREWLESGLAPHVFRLAGIYGPGRSALDQIRAGTARLIDKPGQVFSRIHVDDIVAVILAALDRPHPGRIFNVCDDDPAPPQEVLTLAAALLGVEPPPRMEWDEARATLSPMALGFYADNKRVSNRRMHEELGVRLRYPSYRDGLTALAGKGQ